MYIDFLYDKSSGNSADIPLVDSDFLVGTNVFDMMCASLFEWDVEEFLMVMVIAYSNIQSLQIGCRWSWGARWNVCLKLRQGRVGWVTGAKCFVRCFYGPSFFESINDLRTYSNDSFDHLNICWCVEIWFEYLRHLYAIKIYRIKMLAH